MLNTLFNLLMLSLNKNILKFMKKIWYKFFKSPPTYYYINFFIRPVGTFIGKRFSKALFNQFLKNKDSKYIATLYTESSLKIKDYAFAIAINKEINFLPTEEKIKLNQEVFWSKEAGLNWHLSRLKMYSSNEEYEKSYLLPKKQFIDQIEKNIEKVDEIIEVGTGNAKLLFYLYDWFIGKANKKVKGIELNNEIIKFAKENLGDRKIEFVCDNLLSYVKGRTMNNVLLYGTGTFEFLLQSEFEELLKELKKHENVLVAICEPVDQGYDQNENSTYRGAATYYSHNYLKLFKDAGFKILFENKPNFNPGNLLTLVASS